MKPCPFCGSKETVVGGREYGLFYVRCNECGAFASYSNTREEAIEAWNERVPQTALLRACQVALDALGCDRTRIDRLEAQKIIHAAIKEAGNV